MNGASSAVVALEGLSGRGPRLVQAGVHVHKRLTCVESKAGKENARETRAKSGAKRQAPSAKRRVVAARRVVLALVRV